MRYKVSLLIFLLFIAATIVHCWREWTWTGTSDPGTRRGHTMVMYKSQVIIFGGRTDDSALPHVPKTYEIQQTNGKLEFKTYDEKPVTTTCNETEIENGIEGCILPEDQWSPIGVYYNDVWSYDIKCTRYADTSCVNGSWELLEAGMEGGGCRISLGAEICTHPTERWYHGSEVFNDDTMIVYGGFSQRCEDYCDDMWSFNFTDHTWTEMAELGNTKVGPGKRWKFSTTSDLEHMYLFGGFRLWHGFSDFNSADNHWSDFGTYPVGGYLDDLWQFTKATNSWKQLTASVECYDVEKVAWEERDATECKTQWPSGRAGHASVLMDDLLFIHGGYRTFFPYPSSTGPGSGRGIATTAGETGFTPYPNSPYYLDDMWYFNLTSATWTQVSPIVKPPPRTDHTLVAVGNIFVLFGGYKSNYYYDDTWQFNTTAWAWLDQEFFVHALYPENCTDDLEHRRDSHSGTYREWNADTGLPDGLLPPEDGVTFSKERHYGTQQFSVWAQPTRDVYLSSTEEEVFILQARRQAPGWDGCRDRHDGRADLPNELQWLHPSQRASHTAIFNQEYRTMLIYGGYGYEEEKPYKLDTTPAAVSKGDMWQYDLTNCPKNCSMHGDCSFAKCFCHDGYYGIDCSNSTCPGSVCSFNEESKRQSCIHCCFAGYEHTEDDSYVANVKKLPCDDENPGVSNGVCDGFGKCICRPPFIGYDCSIRDCKHNCSGNGYCSVEFPNSRCMCDDGWIGQYCDTRVCLNNCSYPNGLCLNGTCWCDMLYDPYQASEAYFPYMGEDCSFVVPFARAPKSPFHCGVSVVTIIALIAFLQEYMT